MKKKYPEIEEYFESGEYRLRTYIKGKNGKYMRQLVWCSENNLTVEDKVHLKKCIIDKSEKYLKYGYISNFTIDLDKV